MLRSSLFVGVRGRATRTSLLKPSVGAAASEWRRRAALRRSLQLRQTQTSYDVDQLMRDMARMEHDEIDVKKLRRKVSDMRAKKTSDQIVEDCWLSDECGTNTGVDKAEYFQSVRSEYSEKHNYFADIEESVFSRLAVTPNLVHINTPICADDHVVTSPCISPSYTECATSHKYRTMFDSSLIEPADGHTVYLHGEAAAAEWALQQLTINTAVSCDLPPAPHQRSDSQNCDADGAQCEIWRVSCADTVKSAVIEACYGLSQISLDSHYLQVLLHRADHQSDTWLVGGASLAAVCATFARCSLHSHSLPVCLVSSAREYRLAHPPSHYDNTVEHAGDDSVLFDAGVSASSLSAVDRVNCLLHSTQSSVVRGVTFTADLASCCHHFNLQLNRLLRLLSLCCPRSADIRLHHVSASRLSPAESRRVELHVHVPLLGRHVCVAHVAQLDDHVSRRLHVATSADWSDARVPAEHAVYMVDSVIMNVSQMLSTLLTADSEGNLCIKNWPSSLVPLLP